MTVIAMSSTQAIDLDLSGLTTVLAIVLAIGVVVLLGWMWKLGHRLEGGETTTPPRPERSSAATDAAVG
jgi:hypothetical protein